MNIVQVGTNDGKDDLYDIISEISPNDINTLLLVEPEEEYNSHISSNYEKYNYVIENILIHYEDVDFESFYFCDNKRLSSILPEHLVKHHKFNYEKTIKKCITLNKLFQKYDLINIDILFIDAEGIDDKLIYSIDYEKYNISKIYYENLHIDNSMVEKFLQEKNYEIHKNIFFNGWSNCAIKNDVVTI